MEVTHLPVVAWKVICTLLSPADIRSIRQTCKTLSKNEAVTDALLRSTRMSVKSVEDLQSILRLSIRPKTVWFCGDHLSAYVHYPALSELEHLVNIAIDCPFSPQALFGLLRKFSGGLKSLKLDCSQFEQPEESEQGGPNLDLFLPQLEKLIIPSPDSPEHDGVLQQIVEISPILKCFVGPFGSFGHQLPIRYLSNPDDTALLPAFRNLSRLEIKDEIAPALMERLKTLKISDLQIEMPAFTSASPLLAGNWKRTLKALRIRDWDVAYFEQFNDFPTLPELTRLTLVSAHAPEGLYYNDQNGRRKTLELLSNLPKLKYLSLQVTSFPNVFPANPTFTSNLEKLHVVQFALPPLLVQPMARAFPNLRELDFFETSNAALLMICQHLTTLEVLRLGTPTTDLGLTALTGKNIEKAYGKIEKGEPVSTLRKAPGFFIGSLSNLKRITVVSTKITDASIILGLAYCPKLTSITIERPVLTDRALKFLADCRTVSLQKLDLSVNSRISQEAANFFREKLPFCHLYLHYYINVNGAPAHRVGTMDCNV